MDPIFVAVLTSFATFAVIAPLHVLFVSRWHLPPSASGVLIVLSIPACFAFANVFGSWIWWVAGPQTLFFFAVGAKALWRHRAQA